MQQEDPAMLAAAPLFKYHTEWWRSSDPRLPSSALPMRELADMYAGAKARWPPQPSWRKDAQRGPMASALWAAKEAGWTFTNATTMSTLEGDEISLLTTSPPMLKRLYAQDLEAVSLVKATWSTAEIPPEG